MIMSDYVVTSIKDGIMTILVNRPEVLNAIDTQVVNMIGDAITSGEENDEVKGMLLRGAGDKAFIAGGDIAWFLDNIRAKNWAAFEENMKGHKVIRGKMEQCKKPLIAVVDGWALGGGCELALASRAMIVTDKAKFGLPEATLGIIPGYGGMLRLNHQLGKEMAKFFAMTGTIFGPDDTEKLGLSHARANTEEEIYAAAKELINNMPDKYREREIPEDYHDQLVAFSDENIMKTIYGEPVEGIDNSKFIEKIHERSPSSIFTANRVVDEQSGKSIDEGIQIEIAAILKLFQSEQAEYGIAAFVNKEKTDYYNDYWKEILEKGR